MPIHRMPPEVVNRVAAQLDSPKDVLALEGSCRSLHHVVQDSGPSSPWGQVFHADLHRLTPKQITVGLVPPQNYRDAAWVLPLKHKLNAELTGIRRHPYFEQINLHGAAFGRLKLQHQGFRQNAFNEAFHTRVIRYTVMVDYCPGLLAWVAAQARREIYDTIGQDPSRVLGFLKLKKKDIRPPNDATSLPSWR
jgi:hypothetical protein